jgi:AcrR family transcriptional regulator
LASKKNIDLQQIVQTAVALADENGFESVTLADVAGKLGIRIPSLYNHINGLSGLRYEMSLWGARQLADVMRRAAVGKSGEEAIISVCHALRAFALAHPGIYATTQRAGNQPELKAIQEEAVDVLLAVIQPYGFSDDDQLHAIRAVRSGVHGFIDLEVSGGFGLALDKDESFRQLVQLLVEGLRTKKPPKVG